MARKEMANRSTRHCVPHAMDVALHELSDSGLIVRSTRIPVRVENFSQTGFRVCCPKRLMPFTSVLCEIGPDGSHVGVPTIAQVRWVEKLKSGEYGIGLQYLL